jgi:hypothetical protein
MQYLIFALVILIWLTILLWGSRYIELLWAKAFGKFFFRIFIAPGIIVHEYSHALACLLTGTKIVEIKLFKTEGGHVRHEKPPKTLLGLPRLSKQAEDPRKGDWLRVSSVSQFIISFAPVAGCLAAIFLLGFIAEQYSGDQFMPAESGQAAETRTADGDAAPAAASTADDAESTQISAAEIGGYAERGEIGPFFSLFGQYIWQSVERLTVPFKVFGPLIGILYAWLLLSFTMCLSPSWQDFRNSTLGILLSIAILVVISIGIASSGSGVLGEVVIALMPLMAYSLSVLVVAGIVTSFVAPLVRLIYRGLIRGR